MHRETGSGVIGLSLAAAGVVSRVVAVEVNPLAVGPFEMSVRRLAKSDPVRDEAPRVA
jgi:methylase of polypeptide subunit release factors